MKTKSKIHCFGVRGRHFAFWEGNGYFAKFNGQSLRECTGGEFRPFIYRGLRLRPITHLLSDGFYVDCVIVMRESIFAELVALFYRFIWFYFNHISPLECKLHRVKDGEFIDKYSLTYIFGEYFMFFPEKPYVLAEKYRKSKLSAEDYAWMDQLKADTNQHLLDRQFFDENQEF
jgi:hypothetical protein